MPILLVDLYGVETARQVTPGLFELAARYRGKVPVPADTRLTERDAMLITYGNQLQSPVQPHLRTLRIFVKAGCAA